jgi:RNA polymerase sigma factor (sigma-70 family)
MHMATQGQTNTIGLEHSALFDELIEPHVQQVFRVAYRITRNREDAEDAKQDAFLRAFTHFEDFHGHSKFATWLTRIVINSALMILRKRKTDRIVSLDGESNFEESKAFQEPTDSTPDAEQQYLQKEREATLRDAINRLRPSLRGVVEVAQIGERSIRESAEIIGVSPAATKARLFHARAALRRSLCRFRNGRPSHDRSSIQGLSWNFQQSKEGANHVQTT